MKKLILSIALAFMCSIGFSQINLNNIIKTAEKKVKETTGTNNKLTNQEVISGLKEALSVGTNNSTDRAAKVNGYYGNPKIKIPFPPEAKQMETTLRKVGMSKQVNNLILTLNRAAEQAAKDATPIFLNAIKSMSISDGFSILKGNDNAATQYLQNKTTAQLIAQFKPKIHASLQKVQVTRYWNPLISKYNRIPGVKKMNPNLDDYVTQRAIEGLFQLIAEEELKIRKDPKARVSDILRKVFG